jgi:NADP-reducing hydrogenase subunit HndD
VNAALGVPPVKTNRRSIIIMENNIKIKINGREYAVDKNATILEACKAASIDIPALCYMKDINAIGACRICLVEVKGARSLSAACVQPVYEGMEIFTNTSAVQKARKINLELILSDHKKDCLSCVRSQNCELQKMCKDFGVDDENYFKGSRTEFPIEDSTIFLVRDNNKCIKCKRCVAVCSQMQGISVIGANDRGFDTNIGCAFDLALEDVPCISCGQCIVACPTAALYENDCTHKVWDAIENPEKHVVVCTAPSIRATLGECFGMEPGANVQGKMVAALKRLGFDGVYNMDMTADLTIIEEANELIERIKNNGKLPMMTSCSPGWVKYCEYYYPEFIENLSTCKSPQQMFGSIYKSYYAEKKGLDPKNICVVSVIPCTAKKFEKTREEHMTGGALDVDIAITTRELGRMITRAGINFIALPNEDFDSPIETGSGAGIIFGASGGVMEAALRTAAESILGKPLEKLDFEEVRGIKGVKQAAYKLGDLEIKVAVASGTANAKKVLESVKSGELDVDFIEIMGCPGGCINGGGQPVQPMNVRNFTELKVARSKALYDEDAKSALRRSHENPVIKELYENYLEKPGSDKAHALLHTHYSKKDKYAE